MNSKLRIRRALSTCLCVAMLATYSMVALASPGKIAGELTVSGNSVDSMVTVNGEAARTGRTIFSSSTITTPDSASAVINLGKLGKIQLAPNSSMSLSFDEAGINSSLTAGKLTVIGTSNGVNVTAGGETMKLMAGQSAAASGRAQDDDDDNDGGAAWWGYALIFGGAAAGIIWAATQTDNSVRLGGSGVVVSPTS